MLDFVYTVWGYLWRIFRGALYILDGLTKNKSDIQPDTLVPLAGKNKLYFAFRELGRVVRTMFLLEYISDDALLQVILAAQNK